MLAIKANRRPGEAAAAIEDDELTGRVSSPNSQRHPRNQAAIRAELFDSDICCAAGLTVRASAPVLGLCRQLVAAGFDPATALRCYRGGTLSVRVRSIGAAAALEINSKGTEFVPRRAVRTASLIGKRGLRAADAPFQHFDAALDSVAP
jgi:hypothetical protein